MHAEIRFFVLALFVALVAACTTNPISREPQSIAPNYNPMRIRLLKAAAEHGVLFQISDSVIRDVPVKSVGERCRKTGEADWVEKVYSTLATLDRDPELFNKIHVIEFRRGDQSGAELSKDLDGAVSLVLLYRKRISQEPIRSLSDIPCSEGNMAMIGKDDVSVTSFEWPSATDITTALANQPPRPDVDRFKLDRRFMLWLADRMTLFRLTPEIAFEKTPTGTPLLVTAMARLSEEIGAVPSQPALEYWMKEISIRSHLGAGVKFFGLNRDLQMSTGLHVDSVGKFARKMNGYVDPTYPYVSYRLENSSYVTGSLGDLGTCLKNFMSTYRSPLSSMSSYEMDPDSFLFPGHSCQPDTSGE